ncbi:MAG: hypothetical protein ACRC76_13830, partial [Proteocatella sp.]
MNDQFISMNVWVGRKMLPNAFCGEQVFSMCEALEEKCIQNIIYCELQSEIGAWTIKDFSNEEILKKASNILRNMVQNNISEDRIYEIARVAVCQIGISALTREILHNLEKMKCNWKDRRIEKITEYYCYVIDHYEVLKEILPLNLNIKALKMGLRIIADNMKVIKSEMKNFSYQSKVYRDNWYKENKKSLQGKILILYPEGLVNADYYVYSNYMKKDGANGDELFPVLTAISIGYNDVLKEQNSYSKLAKELYAESLLKENYLCFVTDKFIDINMANFDEGAKEFTQYCQSDHLFKNDKNILGKKARAGINRFEHQIKTLRENLYNIWKIDVDKYYKMDRIDTLQTLKMLFLYQRYQDLLTGKKKNIIKIIKNPSLENSILGMQIPFTINGEMMFKLKNDCLKLTGFNKTIQDMCDTIVLTYLGYEKNVANIRWFFEIDALSKETYKYADEELSGLLKLKLDAADEAYKKISKIGLREEEFACHKLSETVFLKLIELEYKGITYDMNLLYGSMKKLVIPMETRDIERLMKIQKRIDHDGINIIEDFNFEREMKRYKHEIAEIVYPDSIEIGITEINRRILRYKDLWVAISQWYGALREYADFGTMVALVQIDKQMRAGAFALDYLSAYKGDKGKKLVIKFIKNLPQEKYAV